MLFKIESITLLLWHSSYLMSSGFVLSTSTSRISRTAFIPAALSGEVDEYEAARQKFEELIEPEIELQSDLHYHTPLTSSSRRRKLAEIQLLETLANSDDAVDELVSLWMTERDEISAKRLKDMESICSPGLVQEEAALRCMITDYGLDWPEPACRLAALLYFKGNSEESMMWADRVLQIKPWHFEAIHIQRLNCLRLNHKMLWRYSRRALPPLNDCTNNKARKLWVENATKEAHYLLMKAEEYSNNFNDLNSADERITWQ
jgi:tetratricopeptide (TPR) repeat protein